MDVYQLVLNPHFQSSEPSKCFLKVHLMFSCTKRFCNFICSLKDTPSITAKLLNEQKEDKEKKNHEEKEKMKADNGFQDNYSVVVASGTREPCCQVYKGSRHVRKDFKGFLRAEPCKVYVNPCWRVFPLSERVPPNGYSISL